MLEYKCLTVGKKLSCFTATIRSHTGILGQRESGKEEIIKATFRLIKADGEVKLDGVNILGMKDEEFRKILWTKISWVPYDVMQLFNPIYDVASHFVEIFISHGLGNSDYALDVAREFLKILGLNPEEVLKSYVFQLSPLKLKKTALALALFTEPEHVLVDDIEYGISEIDQIQVVNSIIDVMSTTSSIFLISDNDPAVLSRVADHFIVLYRGEILEEGDNVLVDPLHPYTIDVLRGYVAPEGYLSDGCVYANSCYYSSVKCMLKKPEMIKIGNRVVKCHLYPNV
ncbi:ATP-binding cassette domain-containing protein [Stygiolobus caldivivus]|uniref:ATP-binding cassette domain-containing protein n=1 Tax=Stygiolobus caldivivus TaxID=2824673 RepID=UPI001C8475DD|nr:ATP-binding cassette domain-containing protein [Stygiolobus caldivivus]